ncbi:MAG: ribonuclease P protein subunit [Candidatus Marsarchaeota archaeon]|jgi:ribonuclease P protein subunit POP4|nr:ribonuclease P protein subunit [Candidatus Marsarchaeota archaeon]MCL5115022.1 ribonuclease P protein subunit [Candidatus Marsarchaeota archaeon]
MPEYNNKTIVLHELIGLKASVVSSNDSSRNGIKGIVINETKNTVVIRTKTGDKAVPKRTSTFKFLFGRNKFTVSGEEICFRPQERLEKSFKFYKRRRLQNSK